MNNLVYIWHAVNLLKHGVYFHIRESGKRATCEKHIKYLSNELLPLAHSRGFREGLVKKTM
jgi:hypothetical protein